MYKLGLIFCCCLVLSVSLSAAPMNSPSDPSLVTHGIGKFSSIVRSIVRYDGEMWFGTYGRGAFRMPKSGGLTRYTTSTSPLLDNRVNTLTVIGKELWLGTCGGINLFDGKSWKAIVAGKNSVAGNIYHCLRKAPDGSIWVGTTGNGLSVYHHDKWRTYTQTDGLNSNWINDVAFVEDKVFVVTANGVSVTKKGSHIFSNATPKDYPVNKNTVWMTYVADRAELWIASAVKGVWYHQDDIWYHPPRSLLPTPLVYCLETDDQGGVWIGTKKGITHYHLDLGWINYDEKNGLASPYTKVLFWDKATKCIWAGSYDGIVARFDGKKWRTIVKGNHLAP